MEETKSKNMFRYYTHRRISNMSYNELYHSQSNNGFDKVNLSYLRACWGMKQTSNPRIQGELD